VGTVLGRSTVTTLKIPGLLAPRSWRDRAACRDAPDTNFFAEGKTRGAMREIQRAKSVCEGCPVRLACLEAGLDEPYGVWGGGRRATSVGGSVEKRREAA